MEEQAPHLIFESEINRLDEEIKVKRKELSKLQSVISNLRTERRNKEQARDIFFGIKRKKEKKKKVITSTEIQA